MINQIIKIKGMHCKSCELLVEGELKKIPQVKYARVSFSKKQAEIGLTKYIDNSVIKNAIEGVGYAIGLDHKSWLTRDSEKFKDLAVNMVWLILIYIIAKQAGIFNLSIGSTNNPGGLGIVLLIGLTAGFSTCMALVGGLVLGISAKHGEKHPEATKMEKFRPHLYFNLGRILSYFILGGIIGLAGKVLQFSNLTLGIMIIIVGLVMLIIGLQLTEISPKLSDFSFTLPSKLSALLGIKKQHQKEYSHINSAIIGALTFFLPCGFTQAMQLYAISAGNFWQGALIMGIFALGTAPGLLGIGGLASALKGGKAHRFFQFAGLVVVFLAIFNISNGLNLAGISFNPLGSNINSPIPIATSSDGVQIVQMTQTSFGYKPNKFTIKRGVPVKWIINSEDPNSCAASLSASKLGIRKFLKTGENIFEFIPKEAGTISFSCSMGMYRGSFNVIENDVSDQITSSSDSRDIDSLSPKPKSIGSSARVISATYTYQTDIVPNSFEIKVGELVRLEIEVKENGYGCMSSITIPKLIDYFEYLEKGKNIVFEFTPQEPGIYYITCGMGSPRGKIIVK